MPLVLRTGPLNVKNWATEQGSGPNLDTCCLRFGPGCSGLYSHKLRIACHCSVLNPVCVQVRKWKRTLVSLVFP